MIQSKTVLNKKQPLRYFFAQGGEGEFTEAPL